MNAPALRGPTLALLAGLAGFPLWALSYAWVPFRAMDPGPAWVWPAVVVGEVGALVSGIAAIAIGLRARRAPQVEPRDRRRATLGAILGASVLALVVGLNVFFTFVMGF